MNQQPIRIMIDFETLDTCPRASILSLGAAVFGLPFGAGQATFYERASIASNEQLGRSISKSTMEWWDKQDAAIRAEAFGGIQALDDLLENFKRWCETLVAGPAMSGIEKNLENIEIWSRGAGFDCEILEDAFYHIFGKYPFDFRKHMCQRTIERLMPASLKSVIPAQTQKHHALADAIYQASLMDVALRNLTWGKWTHAMDTYAN